MVEIVSLVRRAFQPLIQTNFQTWSEVVDPPVPKVKSQKIYSRHQWSKICASRKRKRSNVSQCWSLAHKTWRRSCSRGKIGKTTSKRMQGLLIPTLLHRVVAQWPTEAAPLIIPTRGRSKREAARTKWSLCHEAHSWPFGTESCSQSSYTVASLPCILQPSNLTSATT